MDERKGDWMQIFTGKKFWPLDPKSEEVDIKDIAHSLAFQCRFNGHSNYFYSIAQHSVIVSKIVSKDQALNEFKERHAGDTLVQDSLAELDENPLQASLNVKAGDSSQYASIVTFLEGNKFRSLVDKINFYENEQVIARVLTISGGLQNWGFLLTMALALIAVLVTFNTVRLTIYSQKQEIEIMRLVGGSNWHIKAPYLVEGGMYGALAAVIVTVMFYPIAFFISPKIESLMPGVSLISYFVSNIFQFVPLILFIGILLGVTSSFVAIRRFLKV